jgi:hypothetical protein
MIDETRLRKRKAGARAIDAEQIGLARPFGKDAAQRQKHSGEGRFVAPLVEIEKLRRAGRNVVDDEIGHDLHIAAERTDVVPGAKARIDLRVIDGIEAGIRAIDRPEERQQMDAAEQPVERSVQQILKLAQSAAREAIGISNQLHLVLHRRCPISSTRNCGSACAGWSAGAFEGAITMQPPLRAYTQESPRGGWRSALPRDWRTQRLQRPAI